MYCVKCGVKLADTEGKCPLCETVVCHPDFPPSREKPLYPEDKMPKGPSGLKALGGVVIILFLVPFVLSFFSDMHPDGQMDWFGYVAGALIMAYVIIALPLWFAKPNPVIFVPCDFAAVALYLWYICWEVGGNWYFTFALPLVGVLALIVTTPVTLRRYVKRGRLYVYGGTTMAVGGWLLMMELLMGYTFGLPFIGWSVYPMLVLALFGGLLI